MSPSEDNQNLFLETANKLWEACSSKQSWASGYTERLAKNLMAMGPEFPGYNETIAHAAFMNYAMRKRHIMLAEVL